MKLNLGCGRDIRPGWINVDHREGPGIDLALNLDDTDVRFPYADSTVTEVYASHIVEHLRDPLPLMAELYRVAVPCCLMTIRTPHGASDDAWEDPTHVRPIFPNSFLYFGQPIYWRADYGYTGDWAVDHVDLYLNRLASEIPDGEISPAVAFSRNIVKEMVAVLSAVKPSRAQSRNLLAPVSARFVRPSK